MSTRHQWNTRVYYDATDAGGIVYHAHYLVYAEQARTEWLRALGFGQHELRATQGIGFVVRQLDIDYLKPALLDDELTVETHLLSTKRSSMTMEQKIWRADVVIASISLVLVCIDQHFRPTRVPELVLGAINPA